VDWNWSSSGHYFPTFKKSTGTEIGLVKGSIEGVSVFLIALIGRKVCSWKKAFDILFEGLQSPPLSFWMLLNSIFKAMKLSEIKLTLLILNELEIFGLTRMVSAVPAHVSRHWNRPNKQNDSSIVVAHWRKEEVYYFPIVEDGDFDHRIGRFPTLLSIISPFLERNYWNLERSSVSQRNNDCWIFQLQTVLRVSQSLQGGDSIWTRSEISGRNRWVVDEK